MQTTFRKWLWKRIQGQLGLPQPTTKNSRCRSQHNRALGQSVVTATAPLPDNPEQMCSSSRGLKTAELEQAPRAEPENTTSEILMASVKGQKATCLRKLNHQETQPSNCLPMISLFLEGDGHQRESTPKQRQSLMNEWPHTAQSQSQWQASHHLSWGKRLCLSHVRRLCCNYHN